MEGAEHDVLLNGDWQNYRPKVVVVEALAPYTLAPAWEAWEPFLARHGYRYVLVRQPQPLLPRGGGERACALFRSRTGLLRRRVSIPQRQTRARRRSRIPTIGWRRSLAGSRHDAPAADRARRSCSNWLTADISRAELEQPADADAIARAVERLFGPDAGLSTQQTCGSPPMLRLREVYAALIDSDHFRAACGRISASYAW